jgi:hypothetical protein
MRLFRLISLGTFFMSASDKLLMIAAYQTARKTSSLIGYF